jgi:hypothetical protein
LEVRSRRRYFSGKDFGGTCVEEAVLKGLHCIGGLLSQLVGVFFEAFHGLLLRAGLKNFVEEVFHLVVVPRGRLVEYVPLEVGLTPIPDAARETGSQSVLQTFVSVACSELDATKPSLLQVLEQLFPALTGLTQSDLETENPSITLLADANHDHCRR